MPIPKLPFDAVIGHYIKILICDRNNNFKLIYVTKYVMEYGCVFNFGNKAIQEMIQESRCVKNRICEGRKLFLIMVGWHIYWKKTLYNVYMKPLAHQLLTFYINGPQISHNCACIFPCNWRCQTHCCKIRQIYRQISNIRRTRTPIWNASRLI